MKTVIVPTRHGHIRKPVIESDRECEACDCGFAVEIDTAGEKLVQEDRAARVENEYCECRVTAVQGEGKGEIIIADPNTNLLHPMTRIPAIRYQIHKGRNEIITEVRAGYHHKW